MSRLCAVLALTVPLVFPAAPAPGQTLSDRIAAFKKNRQERSERAAVSDRTRILQALLYERLSVGFEATPASEVFEYLATALDIEVVVRYDDGAAGGIDPQAPISLAGESLKAMEVLERAVEQCAVVEECTWQLRGNFLEVGTKERLSVPAAQERRVYPLGDLTFEPPHFNDAPSLRLEDSMPFYGGYFGGGYGGYGGYYGGGHYGGGFFPRGYGGTIQAGPARPEGAREQGAQQIVDLIIQSVEPTAWEQNGGTWASINLTGENMVVRAPDFIHRQIGGYPRVPPPKKAAGSPPASGGASGAMGQRS